MSKREAEIKSGPDHAACGPLFVCIISIGTAFQTHACHDTIVLVNVQAYMPSQSSCISIFIQATLSLGLKVGAGFPWHCPPGHDADRWAGLYASATKLLCRMSAASNMNKAGFFKFLPVLLVMLAACQGQPKPIETPVPTSEATTTALTKPLRVLFDDDGSQDGTTALFFLLSDPDVSVAAISISYGEAHPAVYIQHIGRKLDEMEINTIPLGAGQDAPLAGSQAFPEWLRQDSNNFWGMPLPSPEKSYPVQDAVKLMVTTINQSPQRVIIFVSGASTNLAQALQLDPDIRSNIEAVYMMGGAVYVSGNIQGLLPGSSNTVAEWNIYADPQAAKVVFESGLNIYLVPLDATNQVLVGKQDTGQWRAGGKTAQFAADIYDRIFKDWGTENAPVWDLMTAEIMTNPASCRFQALHLDVVTADGKTAGQTALSSDRESNANVCLEPDEALIKQTLIEVFSSSK